MTNELIGARIAILVAHGFEHRELEEPRDALNAAGAETYIVSPEPEEVKAWDEGAFGSLFDVDVQLERARAEEFDALVLPGGVLHLPRLRMIPAAVELVSRISQAGKPIAALSHGPHLLVEADVVRGRRVTSDPCIRKDLINAGAIWNNVPVMVDNSLITAQGSKYLTTFLAVMLQEFAKEVQTGLVA